MNNQPGGLPHHLDPEHHRQTGVDVLLHGLPSLPEVLTYQMSIPLTYWKAASCAVVLFLTFDEFEGRARPEVTMATYARDGQLWKANRWWMGKSWPHDPIANPADPRSLGGRAITVSGGTSTTDPAPGYPADIAVGHVAPTVKQIALIQDGHEDRRPLESHFGALAVCTDRPSAYQINALDENGNVLGSIQAGA